MADDQHRRKRQKTKKDASVVKIGNKSISLDAFLQPTKKPAPPPSSNTSSVPQPDPAQEEASRKSPEPPPDTKKRPAKSRNDASESPLQKARKALPIWNHQEEIRAALRGNSGSNVLLIVGETGSGKSTQTPQYLCDEPWCRRKKVKVQSNDTNVGGMIAITQPRRVAATTLATRVAREMGTPLGSAASTKEGSVGYSVRFDHNIPKGTKIKFLTEGMLLQELLRDPNLRQYSAIIVDEIHERSVDVDLIAGFLKQILASDNAGRGGIPLKVVVMSATADVEKIQEFFKPEGQDAAAGAGAASSGAQQPVQLLRIKGRQYPVAIEHTAKPVPDIQEALMKQIFSIHLREPLPGDILAFLTGQEEIEAAQKLIEEYTATLAADVPRLLAFPLFGQLSMQAQQEAFQPVRTGGRGGGGRGLARKVVLATNIAETSVTVPGVRYVVDGGKAKVKQFRSRLGMESLLAKPISKSSAVQRAGRAGREGPGRCFRLYTAEAHAGLAETDLPEILRNDVLGAVLTMKARGINDVLAFPMMDMPDPEAVEKALVHLHQLGALHDDGAISPVGRRLAMFPVPAPYGRVLLAAADPEFDCLPEAIDIISCLTAGENIFMQLHDDYHASDEAQGGTAEGGGGGGGGGHGSSGRGKDKGKKKQGGKDRGKDAEEAAAAAAAAAAADAAREEAEQLRRELYRREGDVLTYLTAMQQYAAVRPASDRAAWCRRRRVSARTMRQALNVRRQLRGLCVREKLLPASYASPSGTNTNTKHSQGGDGDGDDDDDDRQQQEHFTPCSPERAATLLRCFLRGFASRTALLAPDSSYVTVAGKHVVAVHPSSVLHGGAGAGARKCEAIMFLEHVFTNKNYAKKVSAVQADWIAEAMGASSSAS